MEALAAVGVVEAADVVVAAADVEVRRMSECLVGMAWRPELALLAEQLPVTFTEILAEHYWNETHLPDPLVQLIHNHVTIIPHGVSLSLGGTEEPDSWRLEKLARLAELVRAPYVSEHIAFVRAGGYESGHLLPIERTEEMLEIVIENIQFAQRRLPVPLVLENIATIVDWDNAGLSEAEFISRIIQETGAGLLLDVSNLYANCHNHGLCYRQYLDQLPLESVKYIHIAGGQVRNAVYHDTHAHNLQAGPLAVLSELCRRITPPTVLLERDDNFRDPASIENELASLNKVVTLMPQGNQREVEVITHGR